MQRTRRCSGRQSTRSGKSQDAQDHKLHDITKLGRGEFCPFDESRILPKEFKMSQQPRPQFRNVCTHRVGGGKTLTFRSEYHLVHLLKAFSIKYAFWILPCFQLKMSDAVSRKLRTTQKKLNQLTCVEFVLQEQTTYQKETQSTLSWKPPKSPTYSYYHNRR